MFANKSFSYILPMLDWWDSDFLINGQLRGCFIGDEANCPDLNNHIFLLYRFTGDRWFTKYEDELKNTEYFLDSYEPTKKHVMFVYNVPEWQQANFEFFKQSKFSSFKDDYKKHIVQFHGEEKTKNMVAVMYRHESAYINLEGYINKGLPMSEWTRIPRDIDPTKAINLEEEFYSDKLKFKEDE